MKKIFCIFAAFVFLPCSVSSADGIDMGKPFLIAKACKMGQISKQDYYSGKRVLNNSGCGGSVNGLNPEPVPQGCINTCPSGKYRKSLGTPCIGYCTGISCTSGGHPTPMGDRCYCADP
ncbi:MAG: hypothetical protein IKR09_05825 [Alphaproteobacteria bacterium]|nr:hypothetical protein [Alphaproteobacteria bacterium]